MNITLFSKHIFWSYKQDADLLAETLQNADCVVLTTNHDAFDIEFIKEHAKLIVDMRNMVKESSDKVYNL